MARKGSDTSGSDYEVGYGKPPKATQFKPGQSGNPRGRPPGSLSLAEEARKLLDEMVETKSGGAKIPRRRQLVRSMYAKAVQGNVNAFNALLRLSAEAEVQNAGGPISAAEMSEEDVRFLMELQKETARQDTYDDGDLP